MYENKLPYGRNGLEVGNAPKLSDEDRALIKRGGKVAFRKVGNRYVKSVTQPSGPINEFVRKELTLIKEINDLRIAISEEEKREENRAAMAEFERLRPRRKVQY